jgi:hypothetical protein
MAMQRISGKKKRTVFRSDPVSSPGQSVSGLSIDGPNITIVNPAPTQDSSGKVVSAGTPILSVGVNDATINASYIKTGVLDANLMRTGQIQTIASWNSRSYGSDLDAIEAQQGFTGGYVYLQDWSTVSENTVYAEFAPWGTYESGTTTATVGASTMFSVGDYVRVTGAYFGDPDQLTRSVGLNANVGIIDQQDGPLGYGEIIAVDTVGTGVTYTVTSTSKSTLDSGLVAKSQQYIPTMSKANQVLSIDAQRISGPNPAGIYSVFVTTSMPHDFVVGDYIELASCGPVYSGVWYVVSTPSNNTFVFRHRFNIDFGAVISSESLPSIDAPVAIRVRKAYSVTSNGDLTSASLNIRTAKTQDGGEPVFQVLNDSIVIRKPDGSILLGVTAGGSFIDIGTVTADEITVGGDINANQVVRVGNYPDATSPTFQGIWAGNATPASAEFSVDLDGNLVATNATITGAVRASSGQIGGFTIGATALTATNIVADSSGFVSVGSGNNVAVISGADANYRIWAGNSSPASAKFVVDKAGNVTASGTLFASNANITGAVTATSGSFAGTVTAASGRIGGFTIGATALTATNIVADSSGYVSVGSGNNVAVMSGADANYRFWAGDSNAATANFVVDKAGNITARSFSLTGIGSISAINAITVSDVLGAGVVTNAKIATISANKIQTDTLSLSGLSPAAITSTNFIVSNTGSVTASDVTLSNSGTVAVGASQVGSINLKPNAVGTTNVGGSLLTVWSDHDAASMAASTYSAWNISTITGGNTVGATWTVTTTTAHDIGVGQYVSFTGLSGGTGLTAWSQVSTQNGAVRVTASASSTTFQFKSPYAFAAPTTSSPTVRGYKTLTLVAPGGVFIADAVGATLSPGMIGVGSLALGSNFESIGGDSTTSGIDGTPKPADGEIVFTSATTNPIYDGGGNLYSSDGATNINTSGNLVVGGAVTVTGNISGSDIVANGGGVYVDATTSGGYAAYYFRDSDNSAYANIATNSSLGIISFNTGTGVNRAGDIQADNIYPGAQTSSYIDHNGSEFTMNDGLSITGSIAVSGNATVSSALTVGSTLTANGNVQLGNATTDDVVAYLPTSSTTSQSSPLRITTSSTHPLGVFYQVFRDTSSSRKYKVDIQPLANSEAILLAEPITYIDKASEGNPEAVRQWGLLAEQVAEIPELDFFVGRDEAGAPDNIDYSRLAIPLLSALRSMKQTIIALEARIAELEGRE